MRKTILGLTVIGAIAAPIAFASSASAAVALDGTGTGFVGKGDVGPRWATTTPRCRPTRRP